MRGGLKSGHSQRRDFIYRYAVTGLEQEKFQNDLLEKFSDLEISGLKRTGTKAIRLGRRFSPNMIYRLMTVKIPFE